MGKTGEKSEGEQPGYQALVRHREEPARGGERRGCGTLYQPQAALGAGWGGAARAEGPEHFLWVQ